MVGGTWMVGRHSTTALRSLQVWWLASRSIAGISSSTCGSTTRTEAVSAVLHTRSGV